MQRQSRAGLRDPATGVRGRVARVSAAIPGNPLAKDPGCRFAHPGYKTLRCPTGKTRKCWVNRYGSKYSTLPKFGFIVCLAHPGSSLRGDHVVVTFASRACGGRSVGHERRGQGGLLSVSPRLRADERRCQVRLVCKFPAPSTGPGKLRRNGGPCVRQNRVVLAVVATVKLLRRRQLRQPARCR
jgi:hypothetical protein